MKIEKPIVGGRSGSRSCRVQSPRGIEVLLKKANVDPDFRRSFLSQPVAAAEGIGLGLTESEKLILSKTGTSVLARMVECVSVAKQHERVFRGTKVAAMIAIVLAASVIQPPFAWSGGSRETDVVGEPTKAAMLSYVQEGLEETQQALERYFEEYGGFPSTLEWLLEDPLGEYLDLANPRQKWYLGYRYRGLDEEVPGFVTNYALNRYDERYMLLIASGEIGEFDGVGPTIDPDKHAFWDRNPLYLVFPRRDDEIYIAGERYFEAVFNADAPDGTILEWYLDGKSIGTSRGVHAMTLPRDTSPGEHYLFIIDGTDNYAGAFFTVKRREG